MNGLPRVHIVVGTLALLPAVPAAHLAPLHAQTARSAVAAPPRVELGLGAGVATDARGLRSSAVSVAPGVTLFPTASSALSLGGVVARHGSEEWSAAASVGVGARARVAGWRGGDLALTTDAAASYTGTSYGASFATGDLTPAAELRVGAALLFAGAHGTAAASRIPVPRPAPPLGGVRTGSTTTSLTRSTIAPVVGGGVRALPLGGDARLDLLYREEHARPAGVAVADRTIALALAHRVGTVAASLLARTAPDERGAFASVSASVPLGDRLALQGAAGAYPSNRLTSAAAGRYATAGLAVRFGGLRADRRALPTPAAVPPPAPGVTRVAIRAPRATRVEVAGDWNAWRPTAARRATNDVWYVDLALPPGEYRYAFRVDGERWTVPEGTDAVDDGFGGRAAWLTVRNSARPR